MSLRPRICLEAEFPQETTGPRRHNAGAGLTHVGPGYWRVNTATAVPWASLRVRLAPSSFQVTADWSAVR